jgi:hypothetical protein
VKGGGRHQISRLAAFPRECSRNTFWSLVVLVTHLCVSDLVLLYQLWRGCRLRGHVPRSKSTHEENFSHFISASSYTRLPMLTPSCTVRISNSKTSHPHGPLKCFYVRVWQFLLFRSTRVEKVTSASDIFRFVTVSWEVNGMRSHLSNFWLIDRLLRKCLQRPFRLHSTFKFFFLRGMKWREVGEKTALWGAAWFVLFAQYC